MTARATGGTWDRTARPMYFAAGHVSGHGGARWPGNILVAVNDLAGTAGDRLLAGHLDAGRPVLLDSGIFWLTNRHKRAHGITMDEALSLPPEQIDGFPDLEARYCELAARYGDRLWGYIELDQGGAANKRRTRARLEALGLAPIPVYHPLNDGWDYFDELASGYDRICFGNIVQASRATRVRLMHMLWERRRSYPDLWVHVLGLNADRSCVSEPPDSCDSSSWITPLRWLKMWVESAMLQRVGTLPPSFTYRVGDPAGESAYDLAVGVCSDAVDAVNSVWAHQSARLAEITGQAPYPAWLPGEKRPQPCQ